MFKEFGMVLLIIIIHEFGHLTAATHYKWNTGKITIYPFGGCCKFDEELNRPLKEELIILLAGPLTQITLYFIIGFLSTKGLMTYRNYSIFKTYHYTLLLFNLLPIYPLDGGRILNVITNYFFPYKKGNKIVITVSIIMIATALLLYKSLNFTMMALLMITEIILYLKRQDFLYNRMLLERYINSFNFKKVKIIKNKNNMFKDKKHVILYNNKYITEKDYLKERFKVKS